MISRFLLHGGRVKLPDQRNDLFFRNLVTGLEDHDQVLSIGFAQHDVAIRKEYFQRDKHFLLAQTRNKVKVENATYDNLTEQVRASKSIYITGGSCPELINDISRYPDFISSLRGKLVAGTSAGACLFSSYYLNLPDSTVLTGMGLFPIRLMVHFGNPEFKSTNQTLKILESEHKEFELLKLTECQWVEKTADL